MFAIWNAIGYFKQCSEWDHDVHVRGAGVSLTSPDMIPPFSGLLPAFEGHLRASYRTSRHGASQTPKQARPIAYIMKQMQVYDVEDDINRESNDTIFSVYISSKMSNKNRIIKYLPLSSFQNK